MTVYINNAKLITDQCLSCMHDAEFHEDTADAFCTLCDCTSLHLDVGTCTDECYNNGLRSCDICGRVTDAGDYPDWVDGVCEICDPAVYDRQITDNQSVFWVNKDLLP